LQVKSQAPAVQVGVAFVGAGQSLAIEQQVPLTQVVPHGLKPALHWMPQLVPLQVALPLLGVAHAVHDDPQLAVLELLRQVAPHAW
jgi:hypothetical protein